IVPAVADLRLRRASLHLWLQPVGDGLFSRGSKPQATNARPPGERGKKNRIVFHERRSFARG
ncbi:MAG: hypothetical protein O7D94_03030, partial [Planctomycetota bacterium]|nr:hypothetical protein [Planctomycetota bacterium]